MARRGGSTLRVTAFNVGMIHANSFGAAQDDKVDTLADYVSSWLLGEGPAVVGLNELHGTITNNLVAMLALKGLLVETAQHESNCLLWRTP